MSDQQQRVTFGTIKRLDESTRDCIAFGVWLAVFVTLVAMTARGQSPLLTAGFLLQLTGAYSTFLLCAKSKYGPLVHAVPYICALAGAALLWSAPDFRNAVEASAMFLALIAIMHAAVIFGIGKDPLIAATAEI